MKGPQGQKRPADVLGNAGMIARLAAGEAAESLSAPTQRHKGGRARKEALSDTERAQAAQKAAKARWDKGSV